MAKANVTDIMNYFVDNDGVRKWYCLLAHYLQPTKKFKATFTVPASYTGWDIEVGDCVQHFGDKIFKIVSKPYVNPNQRRKKDMYHEVNISGRKCGANPCLGQLMAGAIFKYPQGSCLYMKLAHNQNVAVTSGKVVAVNLRSGDLYTSDYDKSVVPVDPGTEIVICVSSENKS